MSDSMHKPDQNESALMKLTASCTIYEIAELYKNLSECLWTSAVLKIDLSAVEQVDASCIQLLLAAQLEASRHNSKLEIEADSEAVRKFAAQIYCPVVSAEANDSMVSGE